MVLADAHLDRGDVDEEYQVAAEAFAVGECLESVGAVATWVCSGNGSCATAGTQKYTNSSLR
jgi:hypothetical protein